jgi:signal transduction histidine kinase
MFVNLMGNALKYAGTEAPRVTVTAERAADGWWLCVADCGIGIAAEHHAAIFEPLVRLPGSEGHDGCGLGLAIVRRVVERHGGRIRVESAVGQGSRFLVFLPEAPISGAPPGTV